MSAANHEPDHRDLEEMTNRAMPASKEPKLVKASEIRVGDMLDLAGDDFADPNNDPGKGYEFELCTVVDLERETDECVRLDFDGESIGFPVDHMLKVCGHDPQLDE